MTRNECGRSRQNLMTSGLRVRREGERWQDVAQEGSQQPALRIVSMEGDDERL